MDKKLSDIQPTNVEVQILQLYLSDYALKLHIREISRRIRKNHRTVALTLKKLENKKIMLPENVGKSKQYSLNIANLLTKDYIKSAESAKAMQLIEKHFIIKKMLTELSALIKDTPIILFGSYARGEETKKSDIDILIIRDVNEKIISKIGEFSKRHSITIQVQKSTEKQFEEGIKEKDNLVIEILNNHIILNNIELFVDIFWRYFYER